VGYYVIHKPFTIAPVARIGQVLLQTLVAAWIITLAGGIGGKLDDMFFPNLRSTITQQAGIGLGVLSLLYFLVGVTAGVGLWQSLGMLLVLSGLFFNHSLLWGKGLIKRTACSLSKGPYEAGIISLVFLLLFFGWLRAVNPPLKFDALVYHLSLPKTYILHQKVIYDQTNVFWGMPQLGEMLYTLLMSLAGDESAVILGWAIGVVSILAIFESRSAHLSKTAQWTSVAVLLCGYTFADALGWGYVDWIAFLYGMFLIQILLEKDLIRDKREIIKAGIFTGLALSVKYTAGLLVIIGLIAILWLWWCNQCEDRMAERLQVRLKQYLQTNILMVILCYLLPVLIVFSPWMLKNWIACGQPFYPFFLPAGMMSELRIHLYTNQEPWGDWYVSLLLPFLATFWGVEGQAGYGASIGPLYLLLVPFAWLKINDIDDDKKRMVTLLGIALCIGWVSWGIGAQMAGLLIQTRLYFSTFPPIVFLAGVGFDNLSLLQLKNFRPQIVFRGIVLFVFGLNVFQIFLDTIESGRLDTLVGRISRMEYLQRNLGWYANAIEYIQQLKPEKPILMLFEPRGYDCLPWCDSDEILDEWYILSYSNSTKVTMDDAIHQIKRRGYGYLLVNEWGRDFVQQNDKRYSSPQWLLLDVLESSLPLVQDFGQSYRLFILP
jgi:hypothetical protein